MNFLAPGVLVIALVLFTFLLRREACQERRRHWRQFIAISGFLLIAAIARSVVLGARADCGFDFAPLVRAQNR